MIKSCHGCLKIYGKQREAQRKSNYFLCCLGSSMPLMRKRIEVGWKRRKWVWSGAMIRQQWSLCPGWLLNQSQVSSRWVITGCARIAFSSNKYSLHIPFQNCAICNSSHFPLFVNAPLTGWNCARLKIVNLSFSQPLAAPLCENNSINRDPSKLSGWFFWIRWWVGFCRTKVISILSLKW